MSVLIKGMEMPTDHPLWIVVHPDGTVEANEASASRPVGWHTLRNAAVPVPPHGDLVDKQYAYQNTMAMGEHTRKIILKQIDALPIIIPADKEGEK